MDEISFVMDREEVEQYYAEYNEWLDANSGYLDYLDELYEKEKEQNTP